MSTEAVACEHSRRGEVLRGDELDRRPLALELVREDLRDLGIRREGTRGRRAHAHSFDDRPRPGSPTPRAERSEGIRGRTTTRQCSRRPPRGPYGRDRAPRCGNLGASGARPLAREGGSPPPLTASPPARTSQMTSSPRGPCAAARAPRRGGRRPWRARVTTAAVDDDDLREGGDEGLGSGDGGPAVRVGARDGERAELGGEATDEASSGQRSPTVVSSPPRVSTAAPRRPTIVSGPGQSTPPNLATRPSGSSTSSSAWTRSATSTAIATASGRPFSLKSPATASLWSARTARP